MNTFRIIKKEVEEVEIDYPLFLRHKSGAIHKVEEDRTTSLNPYPNGYAFLHLNYSTVSVDFKRHPEEFEIIEPEEFFREAQIALTTIMDELACEMAESEVVNG